MDIRLLGKNDTGEAKALWKSAFGDSDLFIDTYFDNKILSGNSLGMFNNGLACVVHMLPYKIRLQGRAAESLYIAGAATAGSMRNRGYMRTMLLESLELMRSRGIYMTHLYPFKHSFYERFSWATYSYVNRRTATQGKPANVVETSDAKMLAPLYQNMMDGFDGYVVRGETEWHWRLSELFCDGGKAVVLIEENAPCAYMLYFRDENKAQVIETVFGSEKQAHTLAAHLATAYDEVRYNVPAQAADAVPHGMARVVDTERLLEAFGASEVLEDMRIEDTFAQWNNIGDGQIKMDVSELARVAHMGARVLDKDDRARKSPYIVLNKKFIAQCTCIFEEY